MELAEVQRLAAEFWHHSAGVDRKNTDWIERFPDPGLAQASRQSLTAGTPAF